MVDHNDIGLDDIEQEGASVLSVLVNEGVRRERFELRIVVLCTGTFSQIEKREEQLYLVIFEDLMRLGQEGQTEFFEVDQGKDVKHKVFKLCVKSIEPRDLVEKVVVVPEQFRGLYGMREAALDVAFAGKIAWIDGHVDVFAS